MLEILLFAKLVTGQFRGHHGSECFDKLVSGVPLAIFVGAEVVAGCE